MNAGTLVFAEMYLLIPDSITRLDGFGMKMTRSEFLKELEKMLLFRHNVRMLIKLVRQL